MRATRYSTSRQKACQECKNSKAKCDRQAGGCSRYSAVGLPNGFENLNFHSDLRLTSLITAEDISNRWLRAFIPLPAQTAKNYSPTVQTFIYRIVKSYVALTVRGRGYPPFVHPSQVTAQSITSPLSTCLSLIRICGNLLPGSEGAAADVLQREMRNLHEQYSRYDTLTTLCAFQAYLIYAMALFFKLHSVSKSSLREAVMNLQEIACASAKKGLVCEAEQESQRPTWESWITAEANRRTLYTMYLFDNVLSSHDGLPTFLGTELAGLPAPSGQTLWRAQTRRNWETSYNSHLAEWTSGPLRIDELWPIPEHFQEADIIQRQERVDHWLESMDEFGIMIYTVTSCTHSGIFDKRQKAIIVLLASTAASFSGFSSNIYFPALPAVAHDLKVSVELVNLTVTSYLIFQGIAPSLWAPLSDVKGRRLTYFCTFIVYLGACIGLGLSENYATVIILRSLQSSGSASTIAVGGAVIGDITTPVERGGYMGIFQGALLIPNVIGPVIGGALAGALGWRSDFWFLAIYGGAFLVFLVLLLPETLGPIVGNGGARVSGFAVRYPLNIYQKTTKVKFIASDPPASTEEPRRIDLAGPFRILFSKQAAPIIVFLGIYYAIWQMSITAMSTLFQTRYGLTETQVGLIFIANGAGAILGTLITGKILDADYRRVQTGHEARTSEAVAVRPTNIGGGESIQASDQPDGATFPLEKARLRLLPIFALLQCAAILIFGWTVEYAHRVPIAIPIITTFVTGWTLVSTQSVIMTYLIDVFGKQKAAASASLNLARCLLAAGATSVVIPLVNTVGVGLTFTIAVIVQVAALAGFGIQWHFGGRWRAELEKCPST
ncbi:major facilitator superfamily domain-containing protein [Xylariaceae sp. FL0255]|nr:major facilitator superfamily domain-containing protein [Xylariaceae sp. FL0255]